MNRKNFIAAALSGTLVLSATPAQIVPLLADSESGTENPSGHGPVGGITGSNSQDVITNPDLDDFNQAPSGSQEPMPDSAMPDQSTSNETSTTIETPDAKITWTQDENGLTGAVVDITPFAAAKTLARIQMPPVKASSQSSAPITLNIPQDMKESVKAAVPVENANFGTMAVVLDGSNHEVPYPYCFYDGNGSLIVSVGQSCIIKIKNLARNFADVSGDPNAYPANNIAFLSARSIMSGKGDGNTFEPLQDLKRGELALMLYRYDGQSTEFDQAELPAGVLAEEYFAKAARWAAGSGLMAAGGSLFNGHAPITREQIALILYRYGGSKGTDLSLLSQYQDFAAISSDEARKAISAMVSQGIMRNGTASLRPQDRASRQEAAAMIARWIQPALAEIK